MHELLNTPSRTKHSQFSMGNGERGTGNGERGTGNGEWKINLLDELTTLCLDGASMAG